MYYDVIFHKRTSSHFFLGHVFLWCFERFRHRCLGEIHRSQRFFSRPSGWSKWTRTPCGFLIGWFHSWWRRSSTTLLRRRAIPWSTIFFRIWSTEMWLQMWLQMVERWWVVWKVKDNSKFWCDFGWKYWLDHLRRQMSTNDTNEPICSAFFSEWRFIRCKISACDVFAETDPKVNSNKVSFGHEWPFYTPQIHAQRLSMT